MYSIRELDSAILLREWLLAHWSGEMARVTCTHVAMGWTSGVLCSRVAQTRSCFRESEGRLVYVGQGPAYVVWLESLAGL